MDLEKIAELLASSLDYRKNTFEISKGYVDCELGGTFLPSCGEMLMFSAREFKSQNSNDVLINNIHDVIHLQSNKSFTYSNASSRLFYEVLKKDTNFDFVKAQIRATGIVEVSIIAQVGIQKKTVQCQVLNFGPDAKTLSLPVIDLISLPENGSLILSVRGLSENNYVYGFRWIGMIPASLANMGERIVLIRTFGHKAAIVNRLTNIAETLDPKQAAILKRTIFIIYDAADDSSRPTAESPAGDLRLLIFRGRNFGGGGNASMLVSLVLRAGELVNNVISEILIIDDDAKFDAETLIRQDSFVTGRQQNIISTGVIYAASAPTIIQESGGFWGKFYSSMNNGLEITNKADARLYLPYLIRNSKDVSDEDTCNYIAAYQKIEFSTFIFISFPYNVMEKCGAPLPFFLRNDDVEICLRCLGQGARITVNPNLQIWHETAHSPVAEFYSILHALIINCNYGGLDTGYFYITIMERLSRIAKVGNYVLLRAYEFALQKFAQGPDWLSPQTIFDNYSEASSQLKQILNDLYSTIPAEVANAKVEDVNVISLVDVMPQTPIKKSTIFRNIDNGVSYTIDSKKEENAITESLAACIGYLHQISIAFDDLKECWKNFVKNFSHHQFWDAALSQITFTIEFQRLIPQESAKTVNNYPLTVFHLGLMKETQKASMDNLSQKTSEQRKKKNNFVEKKDRKSFADKLPKGFTVQGYLAHNPDVKEAGMDPVEHWVKYGQFEGRKF